MKNLKIISKEEAKLINGGTIVAGVEFFGVCFGLFYAGWECGRGIGREIKSWF